MKKRIPELPKDKNGLPILSNLQIDELANYMALDFCPDIVGNPRPIDLDRFIEQYLEFGYDIQYLSNCECYLGVTVFKDMLFPVFNYESFEAELTFVPANTIIIDQMLFRKMEMDGHEGRYRFTLAHECGHAVMHQEFYTEQAASIKEARSQLSAYSTGECYSAIDVETNRAEQQANKFASCLLMPKSSIIHLLEDRVTPAWEDRDILSLVRETFNVSWPSAFYRLKELGWLSTESEEFKWEDFA